MASDPSDKASVSIYLHGDRLDPDRITQETGVAPSVARRKGERAGKDGAIYKTRTGVWALELDDGDLPGRIADLAAQIGLYGKRISQMDGVESAHVDVYMSCPAPADGGGTCYFELPVEAIAALSALGLPVRVTIALIGPE